MMEFTMPILSSAVADASFVDRHVAILRFGEDVVTVTSAGATRETFKTDELAHERFLAAIPREPA